MESICKVLRNDVAIRCRINKQSRVLREHNQTLFSKKSQITNNDNIINIKYLLRFNEEVLL